MNELFNSRPYHHKDVALLDRVVQQIKIDFEEGNQEAIDILLDYIPHDALVAYLPEKGE